MPLENDKSNSPRATTPKAEPSLHAPAVSRGTLAGAIVLGAASVLFVGLALPRLRRGETRVGNEIAADSHPTTPTATNAEVTQRFDQNAPAPIAPASAHSPNLADTTIRAASSAPPSNPIDLTTPRPSTPEPQASPENRLAALGLLRHGRLYHLAEKEAEFGVRFVATSARFSHAAEAARQYQSALATLEQRDRLRGEKLSLETNVRILQNEIRALPPSNNSANAQHLQTLRAQMKTLKNATALIHAELGSAEAAAPTLPQLRALEDVLSEEREKARASLPGLRKLCDSIQDDYEALRAREDVHLALDALERPGSPLDLGPSSGYLSHRAELDRMEALARSWPIIEPPPSRRSSPVKRE